MRHFGLSEKFETYLRQDKVVTTISDIQDRYDDHTTVEKDELLALQNFERYRVQTLRQTPSKKFNSYFMELQILSNIAPYQEFLKAKYQDTGTSR